MAISEMNIDETTTLTKELAQELSPLRRTQLLKLMVAGLPDSDIAKITNLSSKAVGQLRQNFLSLEVKSLVDEQTQRIRFEIVSKGMKAVKTLTEIMENGEVSPRVRQLSAQDLLDRAGLKPVEKLMTQVHHSLAPEVLELAKTVLGEESLGRAT